MLETLFVAVPRGSAEQTDTIMVESQPHLRALADVDQNIASKGVPTHTLREWR